jgi:hypothetical protein
VIRYSLPWLGRRRAAGPQAGQPEGGLGSRRRRRPAAGLPPAAPSVPVTVTVTAAASPCGTPHWAVTRAGGQGSDSSEALAINLNLLSYYANSRGSSRASESQAWPTGRRGPARALRQPEPLSMLLPGPALRSSGAAGPLAGGHSASGTQAGILP